MTRIAIAGGHGQIAMKLTAQLSMDPESFEVLNMIRDADQSADIELVGGTPIVVDLENADVDDIAQAITGCDAVLFAAGAGPGSGAERKESVDYGAAVKLMSACQQADVSRYLMVSSMGTDDPPQDDDVMSVYLRAKARADAELMDSGLSWTIVRPGSLTDDDPTGEVSADRHVGRNSIPRGDVASVFAHLIAHPEQADKLLVEVVSGSTPISAALDRAASGDASGG